MTNEDLAFAGVAGQAELLRRGEVSARELVELALARIERADGELNAFGAVYADRALADRAGPAARDLALEVHLVLDRHGDAEQRRLLARSPAPVGGVGLGERPVRVDRAEGVQLAVRALDPRQRELHQLARR